MPPTVCSTLGVSLALPPIIGKFLSPFDVLLCNIFYVDPPPPASRWTSRSTGRTTTNLGQLTFNGGPPQDVAVTPADNEAFVISATSRYTAQEHLKMQLKFRKLGGVIFAQTPELGDVTQEVNFIQPAQSALGGGRAGKSHQVPVQYTPIAATTIKDFAPQAVDSAGGSVIQVDGNAFEPVPYNGTNIRAAA